MLHCNKNRFKSWDVSASISGRLFKQRYVLYHKHFDFDNVYILHFDDWTDFRLNELMDKVYGNHR